MMIIRFYQQDGSRPFELIKETNTNMAEAPKRYEKVTINKEYYICTDIDRNYDIGVINVKLKLR